ncbi:hypothetical protein BSM4216_0779 [Bacillus smithii]|nr:hypothetical protein BSM4216_0779 [Bacillus smithii]
MSGLLLETGFLAMQIAFLKKLDYDKKEGRENSGENNL